MASLTITTHWWGDKYGAEYVQRLARGVRRHLSQPCKFVVITDDMERGVAAMVNEPIDAVWPIEDIELTKVQGCFARLRLFDPNWQMKRGLTGRIVSIDLDCVVTGSLDELFCRADPFLILKGANAVNPCPYNGSVWMLRAGYRPDVWAGFSLEAAAQMQFYAFPDDQAWFHHKMPNENGYEAGPRSGVYAFKKPGWPKGDDLPKGARLVCFPGSRDPGQFKNLNWIKENWT